MTGPIGEIIDYIRGQALMADPAALYRKLTTLEANMAAYDDELAAITGDVENIRGDVTWLHSELVRLQGEAAAKDSEFAAALQPLVDRTAQVAAATPDRPTPAPAEPTEPAPPTA
jgi:hypothetical protein